MGQFFLILVVALTVAAVVFGVTVLVSGSDTGLTPAEPDGRALPLPASRPLQEGDLGQVRFDTAVRGYRMAQVDQALRRAAYDIGYKEELIGVLEAEVTALREGRTLDADALRRAREAAQAPTAVATLPDATAAESAVVVAEPDAEPVAEPVAAGAGRAGAAPDLPTAGSGLPTAGPGAGSGLPAAGRGVPAAGSGVPAAGLPDARAAAPETGPPDAGAAAPDPAPEPGLEVGPPVTADPGAPVSAEPGRPVTADAPAAEAADRAGRSEAQNP
jgi:DivIVA domain-containing protein